MGGALAKTLMTKWLRVRRASLKAGPMLLPRLMADWAVVAADPLDLHTVPYRETERLHVQGSVEALATMGRPRAVLECQVHVGGAVRGVRGR